MIVERVQLHRARYLLETPNGYSVRGVLQAVVYFLASRTFASICPGRSHLSPDGGGVTRAAPPLGSGWLRFGNKIWCQAHDEHSALLLASVPGRSHLRQTVEALLAPHHRLAADGYDLATDDSRSPAVATCRQTVEALLAPHHRLAADGYDLATKFGARHMTNVSHFC